MQTAVVIDRCHDEAKVGEGEGDKIVGCDSLLMIEEKKGSNSWL